MDFCQRPPLLRALTVFEFVFTLSLILCPLNKEFIIIKVDKATRYHLTFKASGYPIFIFTSLILKVVRIQIHQYIPILMLHNHCANL